MAKLILIDGNSIAFRAFYALPLLSNSSGIHTNAVYGFTTMLMRLIEEEQPTHFLVAFDAGKETFRHKEYAEYKGGRAKTPPELSEQFPLIKELLEAFSVPQFELPGYEADDIIGTLAALAEEADTEVLIVSGDKDLLQLASERVTIALTRRGVSEVDRYDPSFIMEKYGLTPEQIIDLKGLMGDPSDNIPGVPGVGEKTALKLLDQYDSVEGVLEHTEQLTGKLQERIREHAESALISKRLATIFREVPVEHSLDQLEFSSYDPQRLRAMFQKLEFKSLLDKLVDSSDSQSSESEQKPITITWENITIDELPKLVEAITEIQTIQIEVTGENPHEGRVQGMGLFSSKMDQCYYVSLDMLKSPGAQSIREWLANAEQPKRVYDGHRAEVALSWHGIGLNGVVFDVALAAYLLDPTESNLALPGISARYLDSTLGLAEDEQVYGKGAKFQVPAPDVLGEFVCRKAMAIDRLVPRLGDELEKNEMHQLYYDLELPLSHVLAEMEVRGIKVDRAGLSKYGEELSVQVDRLIAQVHGIAGEEFNLNSPKQLGEILFGKLGLPPVKKTKTGYSTDAEVLEKLAPYHEIVEHILNYRQLAKLQSTYVEGLLKEVRSETSKIHTYYQQTIAATGRLSSQFPNLQNIPIRMEEGRKIRKVFVPSEPDWLILSADYSQIELRVLAHISQDERLMEAFRNNLDIHTKTAMDVFGVAADAVDDNMRRQAKAVNFGIVYGISDYGLSQNLHITRKEAAQFIEQYFAVFQGVRKFMDDIVQQARSNGYVTTLLQRRRYLPEIRSSNFNLRSFAERTAMNTPIQGTAADIIKLAMVQIAEGLMRENLQSRMLLQVHDELVFEVPKDELERMKRWVPEMMEQAIQLDVPLRADVSFGENWYEAK